MLKWILIGGACYVLFSLFIYVLLNAHEKDWEAEDIEQEEYIRNYNLKKQQKKAEKEAKRLARKNK